MDAYEATRIVLSRIQNLDPENASRIMGLLLIQDHGEKEMIRLAFGPEALVQSVILRARKELGFSNSPFFSRRLLAGNIPPETQNRRDGVDELQLQDRLSFLDDGSPPICRKPADLCYPHPDLSPGSGGGDAVGFSSYGGGGWGAAEHRRSWSVSDACLGSSDDPSSGWKPCLYYARGYCKNGSGCRFVHDGGAAVWSPETVASAFPYSPKSLSLLLQQNETHRAMLSGEDLLAFGRSRPERCDFPGMGIVNPASRQIYLTFPADSTFREEDVSNYFGIFGPVQDVRIPYQQKRMFGFVTFLYPETVKLILAKGNPHFVCDARVLVKPYKEKGKVLDHKKHHQIERGDFSPCGTPTGLDSRDLYDLPSPGGGANTFYNNAQEMLWRRKLEEQALEMQSRRLMSLQLLDVKKHHHHRALSAGSPALFSPRHLAVSPDQPPPGNGDEVNDTTNGKTSNDSNNNNNAQESIPEHNLPDSPFASPTKAAATAADYFSAADKDATNNNLETSSFKSFNCQIPRLSSGHGVIGMFAGNGGSTFPVGI